MVPHCPQHCQAAQLVEPIMGINKRHDALFRLLNEYPCGFQYQMSPPPPLVRSYLNLHPQYIREIGRHYLLYLF